MPGLFAFAKRGPQLAVTARWIVITAANKAGNIFSYSLNRQTGRWSPGTRVNDVPEVAKEGFHAIAAAAPNTIHAVWLDLRNNKRNKLAGATSADGGHTWSANRILYQSPDSTICECCKVSVAANGNDVYIQFRNWLQGARDLHLLHSSDGGRTFGAAQKLGYGTWLLKACPMDGGAVALTESAQPITTWRRADSLYVCSPGQPEEPVAIGRNVTMTAGQSGNVVAWDNAGTVWVKMANRPPVAVGKGQMPSVAMSEKSAVCVWESDGQVLIADVPK